MPIEDTTSEVDFTSDITEDTGADTSTTVIANPGDETQDVRSLLNKAIKGELGAAPPRGPDGKFMPKGPQQQAAGEVPPVEGQQQQVSPDAPISERFKTPAEYQEHVISALPEQVRGDVQKLLEFRDTAFNNWAQNASNQIRGYEAIEQIIAPRKEAWAVAGMQPEQVVNQLFALSDFAERDPTGFIQYFAGQHGIDLATVTADAGEYVDPELVELKRKIAELEGFREQSVQQQQTQAQQAIHARMLAEVEQFKGHKDATGNALHPHYDAVEQDILTILPGLIQANPNIAPQQLLKDAYERAIWVNPTVRAKVAEAERIRNAQENAAKARRAGSSVSGVPAGTVAPTSAAPNTVREALKLAVAQHS